MEYVGVGKRAVAVIIDGILLFCVGYAIGIATGQTSAGGFNLQGGSAFLLFGIAIAYYVVLEAQFGATLGKKLLGIKVVKADGAKLDWQASIVRNLLRIVDGFFFYLVGAIIVWTSAKKQRLGDRVASTVVTSA
jgi:uncharacterized RDD family membrane protein YckC